MCSIHGEGSKVCPMRSVFVRLQLSSWDTMVGRRLGREKMHAFVPGSDPWLSEADAGHCAWVSDPVGDHSKPKRVSSMHVAMPEEGR